jgi:carboxymethylenebutenolidase
MATAPEAHLSPGQQAMVELWEAHTRAEFEEHSADVTMTTMTAAPHLTHVPTLTGGVGREDIHDFYATHFIPKIPPGTETELITRTVGHDRIVDELIFKFTHSMEMDFFLPGVAPTGKRVEVPLVAVVQFRDGKIESEHIYWDQASVLVQIGLIDAGHLPVAGRETAEKLRNPKSCPSNALIARAARAGKA